MPGTGADARLRSYLLEGDFGSSGRLPAERELAQALRISRPALREGLKTLSDWGLVDIRRGDGAYLTSIQFADLLEVRIELEPLAAGLAATRRSTDHLAALRDAVGDMSTELDHPSAFAAADERVHRVVAEACGNNVLRRTIDQLAEMVRFARRASATDATTRARTLIDIQRLVESLDARDSAGAATAMRTHLRNLSHAYPRPADAGEVLQ